MQCRRQRGLGLTRDYAARWKGIQSSCRLLWLAAIQRCVPLAGGSRMPQHHKGVMQAHICTVHALSEHLAPALLVAPASYLVLAQLASHCCHLAASLLLCQCCHLSHHQQHPHLCCPGCCAGRPPWHPVPSAQLVGCLAATGGGLAQRPWSAGTHQQTQSAHAAARVHRICDD
jgi:hypothetical protein